MRIGYLALLGVLAAASAQGGGFDFRYVAKTGDINGDSRTDIYLHYQPAITPVAFDDLTIPVPQTRRNVGQFVLSQQADGKFQVVPATASEVGVMSSWPAANAVSVVVGDFNRDEEAEILLKNVSSAISGASDQLVFAPLTPGAPPSGVRAIDASINKFGTDLMGSANDPNYFDSGWKVVNQYDIEVSLPTYRCGGLYYPDTSELSPDPDTPGGPPGGDPGNGLPNGGAGCVFAFNANYVVTIKEWSWDSTGFSSEAFVIYRAVGAFYSATENKTIPADRVNVVLGQFEGLFGASFTVLRDLDVDVDVRPPDVIRRPQPWWLKELLRVITITRVLTTVGGVLIPESTTSDDTFEYYFHYGFKVHAPLFASGIKAWALKPAYVTPAANYTGLQAQDALALPIKDILDSPPDARYGVHVRPSIPRSAPQPAAPQTWQNFGLTRHRNGGGIEILLFAPTGPDTVFGPFPIEPF